MTVKKFLIAILIIFCIIAAKSDILETDNQADYIVIYHGDFKNSVNQYVDWRQKQKVNVIPVSVDEIYQSFVNDTVSQTKSIRYFISYALSFWSKPSPKNVLLCGGINHIPSFMEREWINQNDSIAIDHYFSVNIHHNDIIPDIAIGRLPARNPEEMETMFNKIMDYEEFANNSNYLFDALNAVDSQDSAMFEQISETILTKSFPKSAKVERAYFSDDSPYHSIIDDFHLKLRDPIKFLNYIGHGNPQYWSHEKILSTEHIDTLQFSKYPFILMTLACSQNFNDRAEKGLAEELLTLRRGGAVAAIGSSGLNYAYKISRFGKEFFSHYFQNRNSTLGDVFFEVKKNNYLEYFNRFTLLGDPMLKIPSDFTASIAQSSTTNDTEEQFFAHPNPFSISTKIDIELKQPSDISISIYDFSGKKIDHIFKGLLYRGLHTFEWMPNNIKSGIYFCRIQKEDMTKVIPLIHEK